MGTTVKRLFRAPGAWSITGTGNAWYHYG